MKKYICIKDYQGGEFGMFKTATAKEWGKIAYDWADSDDWENPSECLLESFKTEQELIDFICDMWEIQLEELSIKNKEVVKYLQEELREIETLKENYPGNIKKWVIETAKSINLIK